MDEKIYPIYFLYGPEDYLIEEEIQRLLKQTLSQKARRFNLHIFSGDEHSGKEIIQTAKTFPMFSRYRFVLVRDADQFDEESIDFFKEYIQNPCLTTCLLICSQTLGPWKRLQNEIEKVGRMIEFPRLKGRGLVSWLKKRIEQKGKILLEDAAEYLIERIGDHLYDLDNAIEKLSLGIGPKREVGLSEVEEITSEIKLSTIFELIDSIASQNLDKSLRILSKALESKNIPFKKEEISKRKEEPIPIILGMMARQYWNILRVKEIIPSGQSLDEMSRILQIPKWNIRKLMEQEMKFSKFSLQDGILKCYQTDLAIKKGKGPKNFLIEKLVIDLCQPRDPFI